MASKGRPSKNTVASYEQMMIEHEKENNSRIYKQEKTDKPVSTDAVSNAISESVATALAELEQLDTGERITLSNTEAVKAITKIYMASCIEAHKLPTMEGLSHALGYSTDALYWNLRNKPSSQTSEWLNIFREKCSELLANNALNGNTHPIVSIFLEKARYGLRDNITIETVNNDPGKYEQTSIDEIMRRADLLS